MSDSIRDQLLKLGLKPSPKPEPKPNAPRPQGQGRPQHGQAQPAGKGGAPNRHGGPGHKPGSGPHPGGKPHGGKPNGGKPNHSGPHQPRPQHGGQPGQPKRPRTQEEIDLAKAYALRAQAERAEAEALKKAAEEKARQKKERKERLQRLLDGKALNLPPEQAELPRHFEHRGKIRRVYVDETQLQQINQGDLGVVQLEARYLVVTRAIAEEVQALAADMVAVLLAPGETDTGPEMPEIAALQVVPSSDSSTALAPTADMTVAAAAADAGSGD